MAEVSNSHITITLVRLEERDSTTAIKVQYLTPLVRFLPCVSSRYSVVDSSVDHSLVTSMDSSVDKEENNWRVLFSRGHLAQ